MNDDISNEIYNELDDIIKSYLLKLSIFYCIDIDFADYEINSLIRSMDDRIIYLMNNRGDKDV